MRSGYSREICQSFSIPKGAPVAKPKLSDVAALAGVSPTTVSRVLNNRGYLSESTRTKVHEAMRELGYRPNAIARSLQGQPPSRRAGGW